jgi:ABC-2 type transport system permease protein
MRLSPISFTQILAGKGFASFLAGLGISLVIIMFGKLIFGIKIADPVKVFFALACMAACFSGLMMLTSTFGKTEQVVSTLSWSIMMPMSMIGGGMVPLFFMPDWLKTLGNISPVKWSILALEGAMWRETPWAEMLLPCGILLAIGAVCLFLGVAIMKRRLV